MVLSAAQRKARATRIGASEVAAIMGEHPYMTALDVYERIVYGAVRETTVPMLVGQMLEPAVLRLARDILGIPSRACSRSYVHPTLPLCASPDAYSGPTGLVEVKVTGAWNNGASWAFWQVQTQLMLTGRAYCEVVALQGSMLTSFTVRPDPAAFGRIREEVERFEREHLTPRVAPVKPEFVFRAKE